MRRMEEIWEGEDERYRDRNEGREETIAEDNDDKEEEEELNFIGRPLTCKYQGCSSEMYYDPGEWFPPLTIKVNWQWKHFESKHSIKCICWSNGGHALYVMVSKIQWKPFWLGIQLYSQNDWTGRQNGVNDDVCAQAQFHSASPKQHHGDRRFSNYKSSCMLPKRDSIKTCKSSVRKPYLADAFCQPWKRFNTKRNLTCAATLTAKVACPTSECRVVVVILATGYYPSNHSCPTHSWKEAKDLISKHVVL